ncbi:hypothetical protein BO94DRAFT_602254 [Aspergillus sclerotioniger CBS 115572]|uniref:Ser/Thr protein phosphatase family protein n=1 Tax=Aspergillus sclerotioniger CBS 115572 TaxID=1450535 RepID=A0A317W4A7_9EURO|nr:hypothetical protein BO94DRAFT_602254 [Aspergillus sclerotioniger CBS 115572]PWY80855.1 hypothetical protein BO94DRAFT_602254 [Aspergillus sclerotioniger CBS 115572]
MGISLLLCAAATAIPALAQGAGRELERSPMRALQQPDGHNATNWPWRPLPWGEINFIHTTDSHGFLEGHLNEVDYGADWGDFVSFVERMRDKADQYNVDLLVVDTGDLVNGNGLSDITDPGGQVSNKLFRNVEYDLLTIGNNDLYINETTKQVQKDIASIYGDRYITTNVDVVLDGKNISVGHRYRYFTTKHGLRVLAFGMTVQDFHRPDFITVQNASTVWNKPWFKEAISKEADLYVLLGHADVDEPCQFAKPTKYNATENPMICMKDWLRQNKPDIPVQILGGHTHARKFKCYDGASSGLESGRYADTVGWLALGDVASDTWNGSKTISGVDMPTRTCSPPSATSREADSTKIVHLDRRYLDFNRKTFAYHSIGGNDWTVLDQLDTPLGRKTTDDITNVRNYLNLTTVLGCAPQSYYIWAENFDCPSNIYTMVKAALNATVISDRENIPEDSPRLILMGTGGIRYDLFKGPFSVGDAYTVSPYPDSFRFIPNVKYSIASQLLTKLNEKDPCPPKDSCIYKRPSSFPDPYSEPFNQQPLMDPEPSKLNPGHVTVDDFGNCTKAVDSPDCGDDTQHSSQIEYQCLPNTIQAEFNIGKTPPDTVNLVFVSDRETTILGLDIIKDAGYDKSDVDDYMDPSFTTRDFLQKYAQIAWNDNSTECGIGR